MVMEVQIEVFQIGKENQKPDKGGLQMKDQEPDKEIEVFWLRIKGGELGEEMEIFQLGKKVPEVEEGMSGTRQRDVLGWNGRSGTSQREELATKVVERLQPSLMVDATVSSHHENGAILSQSANVVSSEAGSLIPRRIRNPTRADLLIPPLELKRLRLLSIPLQERLKIGKLGVTKSIVRIIRQQWIVSELVKVRCHGPAANSIKKILSDLEVSVFMNMYCFLILIYFDVLEHWSYRDNVMD